mgnify:CR=1 FL=1
MPSGMPWHAGLDRMFLDKSGSVTAQQTDYLNASNTSLDLQVCHLSARAHARCRSISYSHTFVLEAVTGQYKRLVKRLVSALSALTVADRITGMGLTK